MHYIYTLSSTTNLLFSFLVCVRTRMCFYPVYILMCFVCSSLLFQHNWLNFFKKKKNTTDWIEDLFVVCRMFFLLFLEIQITEYFPKIMATFLGWILSFSLVVIFIIPPMIQWRDYCMHYICYFGTDLLNWNLYVILSLNTSSYTSKCLQTWKHPSTWRKFVQHD